MHSYLEGKSQDGADGEALESSGSGSKDSLGSTGSEAVSGVDPNAGPVETTSGNSAWKDSTKLDSGLAPSEQVSSRPEASEAKGLEIPEETRPSTEEPEISLPTPPVDSVGLPTSRPVGEIKPEHASQGISEETGPRVATTTPLAEMSAPSSGLPTPAPVDQFPTPPRVDEAKSEDGELKSDDEKMQKRQGFKDRIMHACIRFLYNLQILFFLVCKFDRTGPGANLPATRFDHGP